MKITSSASAPATLQIAFVGAGNLATQLAHALHQQGHHICQVYSRTEAAAQTLAQAVNASYTTSIASITPHANLYIVALKDAVLADLIPQITQGKPADALFVHTAGSIPMSVWQPHCAHYGVLYPMQTFSKQQAVDFRQIPIFLEASTPADLQCLHTLADTLSSQVYHADSEQRKNLHLAAVFTCNFTNHMYALAAELLQQHNLPFQVMLPLIDETARKVHTLQPRAAQTGPAVRFDENVMNNHLDMLQHEPRMHQVYELLSQSIHELTQKNNQ